ncbi:unnamed protein product [Lupinus luteus]|uniref:Potassium transporter n=1 Tax=Lupinus luteus TaxID=3873 RepID=A0AAV1X6D4_LUPLU
MGLESFIYRNPIKDKSWSRVLTLAYQSLGVVYGDLCTSPLYVYKVAFGEDIEHSKTNEEIYGVLSFIFWTVTLIPLLKYVFIVLRADDNGEGGTFALYSLLCRHARVSLLPDTQIADEDLTEYTIDQSSVLVNKHNVGSGLKILFEKHRILKRMLLVLTLIGSCTVIGDGVLTPAISVFCAVSGLELSMAVETHKYVTVPAACIILILLFALQHYGTHRVGFMFAPIVLTWLLCISIIGCYNIFHWNPYVYEALSPYYMFKFLKKTRNKGWMSLGGILLCITGSEAMFADLGHFSQFSIKIAFTLLVYPSLILAYMGQAAYLSKHHFHESNYQIGFYVSVPVHLRWPIFIIAILQSVVGSQAIITGTFSIIKQCSALGCFPEVKIVHTSSMMHGQVYIPGINWSLMLLCLAIIIGYRDINGLGNAAGLAVITVMLVTTCLMSLVIVICWRKSVFLAICFLVFFGSIEALYFSAAIIKFLQGAWVPIALSLMFFVIMYVWHYGTLKKYKFDVENMVPVNWILGLGPDLGIVRVKGIGLIHTNLVSGIPAIFSHFVTNLPAFHQVLIFLCVKSVPVPHVKPEERFLVGRVGPKEYRMYRCIARYGYRDYHKDDIEFEDDLVCSIAEFIRSDTSEYGLVLTHSEDDTMMTVVGTSSSNLEGVRFCEDNIDRVHDKMEGSLEMMELVKKPEKKVKKRVRFVVPDSPRINLDAREELHELVEAKEAGMVYIVGQSYMRAKSGSSWLKKVVINYGYEFLRQNSRGPIPAIRIPETCTLEVGMIYQV